MMSQKWRMGIICSKSQIDIDILLNCGQCFRWKRKNYVEWIGVLGYQVWHLYQTGNGVLYKVYGQQSLEHTADEKRMESTGHISTAVPVDVNIKSNKRVKRSRTQFCEVKEKNDTLPTKCKRTADKINGEISEGLCHQPSLSIFDKTLKVETLNENIKREKIDSDSIFEYPSKECEEVLKDYFQFDINLYELYDHWSSRDPHFKEVAGKFGGIRMLRQDPTENLLSFVCSSNNHISRISSMVEKLCLHYGTFITEVDGEKYYSFPPLSALTGDGVDGYPSNKKKIKKNAFCCEVVDGEKYYSFPPLSALTGDGVDGHLRELGFGYRAKFISAIAKHIMLEKGEGWLESLRKQSYQEAKQELMKLFGVGAKVADCVCLMSLDKPQAVPVDTHVWQITQKHYMAKLQSAKSLTDKLYNEIGDFYRNLWGPYAGWAHSVLFTADLKHNKAKGVSTSTSHATVKKIPKMETKEQTEEGGTTKEMLKGKTTRVRTKGRKGGT